MISLAAIVLYFVTSSDSGSLVVDCLSSNGHPDPPILQRVFWALTEGAAATALLVAGGDKALTALRTVSIAAGLPYTIVLNFMCVALWRAIKIEGGDLNPNSPTWSIDLISVFCKLKTLIKFTLAILAPWFYIGRAYGRFHKCSPLPTMITMAIIMYGWIILCALEPVREGLFYVGWTTYFFFATYGAGIRIQLRTEFQINGNMVEDWFAVFLLYPAAAVQMDEQMEAVLNEEYSKKNDISMTAMAPPYVVHSHPHLHPTKSPSKTQIMDSSVDHSGAVNRSYDETVINNCNGNLCSQL